MGETCGDPHLPASCVCAISTGHFSRVLGGLAVGQVLVRLGMVHLIRQKVKLAAMQPDNLFLVSPSLPASRVGICPSQFPTIWLPWNAGATC